MDGGILFAARRDLQGLADGAARAGAMAVDVETLRKIEEVRLDPQEAETAARAYLASIGFGGTASVTADTVSVSVHLSAARSTVMIGLVGVESVAVEARSVARPRTGIDRPEA